MEQDSSLIGNADAPVILDPRAVYAQRFLELGRVFLAGLTQPYGPARAAAGLAAVAERADAVDDLVRALWAEVAGEQDATGMLGRGVALVALGGYGRRELFPYSDVDLLFLLDSGLPEKLAAEPLRRLNQALWDAGLRVSAATRSLADCERFDPQNIEAVPALLDARPLAGDLELARKLKDQALPRLVMRERKRIVTRLLELSQARHARFGNTLFHLEPNIKECPGGLRDAHLCAWLAQLGALSPETTQTTLFPEADRAEFDGARTFLVHTRTFLHLRHRRDDNVLDWQSQNEAAQAGRAKEQAESAADAAFWMRLYFRHARAIARRTAQAIEDAAPARQAARGSVRTQGLHTIRRLAGMAQGSATGAEPAMLTAEVRQGDLVFKLSGGREEKTPLPVSPELALEAFTLLARTGARLPQTSEERLADALPALAAQLEDGPGLRRALDAILTAPYAGKALRAMHALGVLELFVPEFHGVDALVIRDAYHRYTVDEHTFVVIDTLHALLHEPEIKPQEQPAAPPDADKPAEPATLPHAGRFAGLMRELPQRGLLFTAALLHDTGKGYTAAEGAAHALESARLAERVLSRLEYDSHECGLVVDLIRNHLQMSATLRRDVFDAETVKAFAALVGTPVALRMLTLLTYADISAVHPGALTAWKAENLWLLYIACANVLDRNVEEERLALKGSVAGSTPGGGPAEKVLRVRAFVAAAAAAGDAAAEEAALDVFLEGLPRRYLETRSPEQVRAHLLMARSLANGIGSGLTAQVALTYAPDASELTLVASDRPLLFALLAGALAAWGMNILTADAFSNAEGLAVDSFRFTDTFRTLELNDSERERFVTSVRDVVTGKVSVETLLAGRRRRRAKPPKRVVEARIDVDDRASSHSTIMQVIAQDTPGLLRALALTLADEGLNIEVALVDTEGEMAIDVFYLTRMGRKLAAAESESLRAALLRAIAEHNA